MLKLLFKNIYRYFVNFNLFLNIKRNSFFNSHSCFKYIYFWQGKRIVSENGEEGWSDVVQENAILTAECEALRRRVKAMQGTIEQLSARNSELLAEKALGNFAPKDGSPDANDCSLTSLVQVCPTYTRDVIVFNNYYLLTIE